MNHLAWIGITCIGIFFCGCSAKEKPYVEQPIEGLYKKAFNYLKEKDYVEATDAFDEVERQHPYSSWAGKAQLMAAYTAFKAQKFERAIGTLDTFITLHPSHSFIAYAYYLRGICYYTDISPVLRDKTNAELAFQAFEDVIRRFPDTEYAQDAAFKCDFIKEHLAAQDIAIGRFYLKNKNYLAAIQKFIALLDNYPQSILIPETLHRIVECEICFGFMQAAKKTASILGHNFPNSPWYQRSYVLIETYAKEPVDSSIKKEKFPQKTPLKKEQKKLSEKPKVA